MQILEQWKDLQREALLEYSHEFKENSFKTEEARKFWKYYLRFEISF